MLLIEKSYWLQRLQNLSQQYELAESLLLFTRPEEWGHYPAICKTIFQYFNQKPIIQEDNPRLLQEYLETGIWALEGFFFFRDVERFATLADLLTEFIHKTETKHPYTQAVITPAKLEMAVIEKVFSRVMRYIAIEKLEEFLSGTDQEALPSHACFWVGIAYACEEENNESEKKYQALQDAWLHSAWQKSDESLQRLLNGYILKLQLSHLSATNWAETEKKVHLFKNHTTLHIDKNKRFWASAGYELWYSFILAKARLTDAPADKKQIIEPLITELETEIKKHQNQQEEVYWLIKLNEALHSAYEIRRKYETESATLITQITTVLDQNMMLADKWAHIYQKANCTARKAQFLLDQALERKSSAVLSPNEKKNLSSAKILQEWKEALRLYKEGEHRIELPSIYIRMAQTQYHLASNPHHVLDALVEGHKFALKKTDSGSFHLIHRLFEFATDVLTEELDRPGYAWAMEHIPDYFALHESYLKLLSDGVISQVGISEWNRYRKTFYRFREVANVHTRAYLRYQLYSVKVLKISALMSGDGYALQQADYVLEELKSPLNPLSIMEGDWKDVKDVTEKVQANLIERAILMLKGDLQRVAEHLPVSYRNLRNYISIGQIRRLGFFSSYTQTHQKALETGIRIILEELFKERKEIEGLFDLPKFLIEKASQKSFDADELTVIQGIKEPAARRYAKFFAENGLLKPDEKRKNHYSVHKEFIHRAYLDAKERNKKSDEPKPADVKWKK